MFTDLKLKEKRKQTNKVVKQASFQIRYDLFVYIDVQGNLLGDFFVQVNFLIELFCLLPFSRVQLNISLLIKTLKLVHNIKLIINRFFSKNYDFLIFKLLNF